MQTTITLGGHLGRKFGREWSLDLSTPSPAEAVRALSVVCKGFKAWILANDRPGYHVFRDRKSITAEQLKDPTGKAQIHIMPALTGAKSGILSTIFGGVLIAAGVVVGVLASWTGIGLAAAQGLIGLGLGMVSNGVSTLLATQPEVAAKQEQNSVNYVFTGPANTTGIGGAIPICYGRVEVGSQIISASISQASIARDLIAYDDPNPNPPIGRWHGPRTIDP